MRPLLRTAFLAIRIQQYSSRRPQQQMLTVPSPAGKRVPGIQLLT